MLYKVLTLREKILKMLSGIFKLHTLHPAQSQAQSNELPQKESPFFLISVALCITSASLSQVDTKAPLGEDGNLEVVFSGSPSLEEAYKTEKFQAACPPNLCMSPG